MRSLKLLLACVTVILVLSIPRAPALAQDQLSTSACGLGQYWLVRDNGWDSVWSRQGDSSTFDARGAFWMQPDGSATMNITLDGSSVFVERTDAPNIFGTMFCSYEGTIRPDGVSVVGSTICQLNTGISRALSWSAEIVCDTPVVTWHDTAFWHRAAKARTFSFQCPSNGVAAPIWGTDIYIEGSSICTAGVHAGAITLENGGVVTIEILPGELAYPGSARNGITSETFGTPGQFDASFRVLGGTQDPRATPVATPVLGTGAVQVTLTWDNQADMDVAVIEPNGSQINYSNPQSSTGGQLDVDSFGPCGQNPFGVENIFWPASGAPSGIYQVLVREYSECGVGDARWTLTVRVNGNIVLTQQGVGGNAEYSFTVP